MNRKAMTPRQYLAQHELTARLHVRLKGYGVRTKSERDALLEDVQFSRRAGDEFRDWPVRSEGWPIAERSAEQRAGLLVDQRAWCTLRWLILENPPESRDRRDAWEALAMYLAQPLFTATKVAGANLQRGRDAANAKRKAVADEKAIALFRAWEKNVAVTIRTMDAAQRLDGYITSKRLPDRQQRRLRALSKEGRLNPE